MMKGKIKIVAAVACCAVCLSGRIFAEQPDAEKDIDTSAYAVTELSEVIDTETLLDISDEKDVCYLTDAEIELIALVTIAEAENECEYGQRLVIDTILNRVDSEHFPNTVYDVIWQPKHFSVMWNGRIDKCSVDEDICALVREEAENRSDCDVIFFTAGDYSEYGDPMYSVGGHYFSSYE